MPICHQCNIAPGLLCCGAQPCRMRYCSEAHARLHWTSGHRQDHIGTPLSGVDETTTAYDVITEANTSLLETLASDGHARLASVPGKGDQLSHAGYITSGSDGVVLNVVRGRTRHVVKLGITGPLRQAVPLIQEGDLHEYLVAHLKWSFTKNVTDPLPAGVFHPVVNTVDHWVVETSLSTLFTETLRHAVPGTNVQPLIQKIAADANVAPTEPLLIAGEELEYIEDNINTFTQKHPDKVHFYYAQTIAVVALLGSHGLVHNDLHTGNVRMRRIRSLLSQVGVTLPDGSTAYVRAPKIAEAHNTVARYMVALSDFGRSLADYTKDEAARLRLGDGVTNQIRVWNTKHITADVAKLIQLPNMHNPGYDLYRLANDLASMFPWLYDKFPAFDFHPLRIILRVCLPSPVQADALHRKLSEARVDTHGMDTVLQKLVALAHAPHGAELYGLIKAVRDAQAADLRAPPNNYQFISWAPEYLATPMQAVQELIGKGIIASSATDKAVILRWE